MFDLRLLIAGGMNANLFRAPCVNAKGRWCVKVCWRFISIVNLPQLKVLLPVQQNNMVLKTHKNLCKELRWVLRSIGSPAKCGTCNDRSSACLLWNQSEISPFLLPAPSLLPASVPCSRPNPWSTAVEQTPSWRVDFSEFFRPQKLFHFALHIKSASFLLSPFADNPLSCTVANFLGRCNY